MNIRIWKVQVTFSDKEKLVCLSHKGLSIEREAQRTEIRNATDEIGQHFSEPLAEHIHIVYIGNSTLPIFVLGGVETEDREWEYFR
ncbi:unnamed protein product [Rhizophagus irregularis]|nr:unnamed protein product [Rhizophagus irregularis]